MQKIMLLVFVAIASLTVYAQEKTISGVITDDSGPLPGVSILIKGTTTGTETDFDGKYSIKVKVGDVLVFNFVGMVSQEETVGKSNIINIVLESHNTLDEVVVTAMGIRRERKSIGYSVSMVSDKSASRSKSYSVPQSGQLTAGEINDLDKWNDWLKVKKKNKDFRRIRNDWELFLEDKIEVSVKSEDNEPINNATVFFIKWEKGNN